MLRCGFLEIWLVVAGAEWEEYFGGGGYFVLDWLVATGWWEVLGHAVWEGWWEEDAWFGGSRSSLSLVGAPARATLYRVKAVLNSIGCCGNTEGVKVVRPADTVAA